MPRLLHAGRLRTASLIVDEKNRSSVNFHPLPSGRFALSRTCAGPPEYSGRGGRQLYTHFLIVDEATLQAAEFQPFLIYRDAAALGYFIFHHDPSESLQPVNLSHTYSPGTRRTGPARLRSSVFRRCCLCRNSFRPRPIGFPIPVIASPWPSA